jgi:hypothetical protein
MPLFTIEHHQSQKLSSKPFSQIVFTLYLWQRILSCMKTRTNVASLVSGRKRRTVSSRPKHRHDWYKSLTGGFRCACEVWRCEFAEGSKQCDSAAEQGRRYCLAHSASSTQ